MLSAWPFLNGKREGIILDMGTPYLIVLGQDPLAIEDVIKIWFQRLK